VGAARLPFVPRWVTHSTVPRIIFDKAINSYFVGLNTLYIVPHNLRCFHKQQPNHSSLLWLLHIPMLNSIVKSISRLIKQFLPEKIFNSCHSVIKCIFLPLVSSLHCNLTNQPHIHQDVSYFFWESYPSCCSPMLPCCICILCYTLPKIKTTTALSAPFHTANYHHLPSDPILNIWPLSHSKSSSCNPQLHVCLRPLSCVPRPSIC
jgi:hypothetical protein